MFNFIILSYVLLILFSCKALLYYKCKYQTRFRKVQNAVYYLDRYYLSNAIFITAAVVAVYYQIRLSLMPTLDISKMAIVILAVIVLTGYFTRRWYFAISNEQIHYCTALEKPKHIPLSEVLGYRMDEQGKITVVCTGSTVIKIDFSSSNYEIASDLKKNNIKQLYDSPTEYVIQPSVGRKIFYSILLTALVVGMILANRCIMNLYSNYKFWLYLRMFHRDSILLYLDDYDVLLNIVFVVKIIAVWVGINIIRNIMNKYQVSNDVIKYSTFLKKKRPFWIEDMSRIKLVRNFLHSRLKFYDKNNKCVLNIKLSLNNIHLLLQYLQPKIH